MSTPTAKDLLAQADRLMRQRTPEELPVLTDLVIEEIEFTSLTERRDDVIATPARPAWASPFGAPSPAAAPPPFEPASRVNPPDFAPTVASPAMPWSAAAPPPTPMYSAAAGADDYVPDVFGVLPRVTHDAPSSVIITANEAASLTASATPHMTATTTSNAREQFNAQLVAKLEEMQHGVYSQVMQQLEIYASGTLKAHLRDTLLPALTDIARDIANQVAEDTSNQVREVVSKAVESEIARLREQLASKRRI